MSIFDLQKRQQAVNFVLEKRNLVQPPAMRVGVALDVSGSAKHLYLRGVMQSTIDRLVPIGLRFDDNGEIDVWLFDTQCAQLPSIGRNDYEGFIKRAILDNPLSLWGGTAYAPPMQAMLSAYFGAAPAPQAPAPQVASGFFGKLFGSTPKAQPPVAAAPKPGSSVAVPAMGIVITDGANSDRSATKKLVEASQGTPIYWQMVGVGDPSEFQFIETLAAEYPNVGFVRLDSLALTDDELYDKLLTQELANFIKKL